MSRNLKALGLCVVSLLALSAVVASGASAVNVQHHFTLTNGSAGLEAEAITEQVFEPVGGAGLGFKCKKVNIAPTGALAATLTELTVEPLYSECQTFGKSTNVSFFITTNGCHYLFTGETTESTEHATVHLICPEGKAIEIKVTALKLKCADIGTQTLEGVHYTNNESTGAGKTHVEVKATVTGIHSQTTESAAACGTAEDTTGTYNGEVTLTNPGGSVSVVTTP